MSHPDDDLRRLLGDAVDDLTPRDRLGEIRRRTAPPARRRRPLVALSAGLATAAVVGGIALVGGLGLRGDDEPPVAGAPKEAVVGTYFVKDALLYREFQVVDAGPDADRALAALRRLEVDAGPEDPDYTTGWPDGAFREVVVANERIAVRLGVDAVPSGLAAQQAVHTVQGVLQSTAPVVFLGAGGTSTEHLRDNRVVAPVNISDPVEGLAVGDVLAVRGRVAPHQPPRRIAWQLRDPSGRVVQDGTTSVADLAWSLDLDVSGETPGRYVVAVFPLGRPASDDTRTVTVR
ncbi:hypothetical protein [Nocardioides sp. LML1-1-1.1]|uniref:hypothetical protein n=1 Tax=Nocardioides sp. LML1-1-1.1 TaxID=3135248 RepID=UPI003430CED9